MATKQDFKNAYDAVSKGPKRNFKQTYDLIVTLKDIDLKKTDNHVDFFATLHFTKGKKVKVCGLVGAELAEGAKEHMDTAIVEHDFAKVGADKKAIKKLAQEHDFFVAQANIMPKVAQSLGKVLGPKGKMPNPKAGCVVPPNMNMKMIYEKLQKTVRIAAKTQPMMQVPVGIEGQDEKEVLDNIWTVYDQIVHHLPNEKNNVNKIFLKLTMGKPILVGASDGEEGASKKVKKAVEKEEQEPKVEPAPEESKAPSNEVAGAQKSKISSEVEE